jgi:hypothetical protein
MTARPSTTTARLADVAKVGKLGVPDRPAGGWSAGTGLAVIERREVGALEGFLTRSKVGGISRGQPYPRPETARV